MVKHVRLDNRLLHGIVASQWAPKIGAMRVMVIDDEVATDSMKKDGMKLAKPAGCALSIITLETALTNFKNNKYDGQTIFLITKEPQTVLKMVEAGIQIPLLNVGSTAKKDHEYKITTNASLTKEEYEICKKISGSGTEIIAQYILADAVVPFSSFAK